MLCADWSSVKPVQAARLIRLQSVASPAQHGKGNLCMGGATNNMTTSTTRAWESKRTPETRAVEELLRESFEQADSYRYNSAGSVVSTPRPH